MVFISFKFYISLLGLRKIDNLKIRINGIFHLGATIEHLKIIYEMNTQCPIFSYVLKCDLYSR